MLSQHYVQRKSIIFIVDSEFSSVFYQDIAMAEVMECFEELDDQDYFGILSLGKNTQQYSCMLEKKGKNTALKRRLLKL